MDNLMAQEPPDELSIAEIEDNAYHQGYEAALRAEDVAWFWSQVAQAAALALYCSEPIPPCHRCLWLRPEDSVPQPWLSDALGWAREG